MAYVRIPDAVHEELLNWSRWCWLGAWPHPLPSTQCGSLESGYRAPPDWNPDDPPLPPPIRPNQRHAEIVHTAWKEMDKRAARVLKAEYPGRESDGRNEGKAVAAIRMNMPVWLYDEMLMKGVRLVEAAFAAKEKKNSVCA